MTARRHRACAPGQPASPALRLTRPRPNVFADIEPGKYSKLNAGRPVCMCFSWLAVYIVLALLMALGLKDFSIMMNFVFSDEKATTNLQFQGFAEASKPENRYESRSFAADNTTYMESAYTYDAFDGGNLFDSADKVSAMARAEEFHRAGGARLDDALHKSNKLHRRQRTVRVAKDAAQLPLRLGRSSRGRPTHTHTASPTLPGFELLGGG